MLNPSTQEEKTDFCESEARLDYRMGCCLRTINKNLGSRQVKFEHENIVATKILEAML